MVRPAAAPHPLCGFRLRGALLSPPQVRRDHHQQHRLPADPGALRSAPASADRRRVRGLRAADRPLPAKRGLGNRRRPLRDRHLDDHHRDRRRIPRLPELPGGQTARCQGPGSGPQRDAAPGGGQRVHVDAGIRGRLDEPHWKRAGGLVRLPFRRGARSYRSQLGADAGRLPARLRRAFRGLVPRTGARDLRGRPRAGL